LMLGFSKYRRHLMDKALNQAKVYYDVDNENDDDFKKMDEQYMGGCPFADQGPAKIDVNHDGTCDEVVKEELDKEFKDSMDRLLCVCAVSVFFIAAQLTGGILAQSIAIMCDTAHLASDMVGFLISISALRMGMKRSDMNLSFGW